MRCPFCGHDDTQVIDSRPGDDGDAIKRRRRCLMCERRFSTFERVERAWPTVVKRDGSRVDYDRRKLRGSLMLALRKRPVPSDQVDEAVKQVEAKLLAAGSREVATQKLGEWVMQTLHGLDHVGYVRYASVYRSFEDVNAFRRVLDEVANSGESA